MRMLRLNSPEWHFITIGAIAAIVMGASFPAFAIIFGDFYGVILINAYTLHDYYITLHFLRFSKYQMTMK